MKKGYIAISSVLVIGAVIFIISLSVGLLSINDIQSALANKKSSQSRNVVEGCAEDVLLQLNLTNAIPGSIILPEGTCSVTINSQAGNTWTFTVNGTINGYTKSIRIVAQRSSTVDVLSWTEQ